MRSISATDAKNRFGEVLEQARAEPVHVHRNGRDVAVVLSVEEYQRLTAQRSGHNPAVVKAHAESTKRYGRVYAALAK